ncbi:GlxA family transcriptional regulator [Modicisalibacter radicis]|uniref:GlxA family transcriptional regulator n=1 Tax=Halomonas sp. EAR18 TaxID=2518972 RepID=UPI00109BFB94|nr:helix-turn-helix domain-containing protein [Halomonas sp. EAR18]
MPRRIVLIAYPDCQLLDVTGPWQVFASANALAGRALYTQNLAAETAGALRSNAGLALHADLAWAQLTPDTPIDTLLVAGGSGVAAQRSNSPLLDRLVALAPHCRRLGSICTGAFLLAAAGLLDDCRVTTHWRYCQRLAEEFPRLRVAPDALYLETPPGRDDQPWRYTSAGVTAGIDLALSLVEADHGSVLAGRVARELVVFLRRPGGQSQFSEVLRNQQHDPGPLRRLLDELHADPAGEYRLADLAERVAVTPRHLSRLFQRHLATTPGAYLTRLRLEQARQVLIAGPEPPPLERLARRWRLGGAEQLRRLFQRHYGVSPSVYRQRFRGAAAQPDDSLAPAHPGVLPCP